MGYAEAQYTVDEAAKTNGIPPKNITTFRAAGGDGVVNLTFTPPSDTVIDDQTICSVGGILIIRKEGSAPTSMKDGEVVAKLDVTNMNNYISDPLVDDDVVNEHTYYYGFFTMSDHGVYNYNQNCVATATPSEVPPTFYKFAYHQDFTELDPDATITYLNWGDKITSSSTPMHTNGDTGTVTAGDFEQFYVLQQNKPYMVKTNFQADYPLDPTDYTKKLDGTASDVSNTSYSGLGAYAWIPRFYMKEVYAADGNSRDVYFSNEQEDSDFQPVGFMDYSIGAMKGAWIPMYYPGSDGKSFAGRTGDGGANSKTCDQQKTLVDLNGANARFLGGSIMNAYRDLCYGLFKSTDIQEHGGYGNCNGASQSAITTNPVLSNGAVEGFLGTGTSSDSNSRKQANKAFHSNVLFTYDMYLRDPYTLFYTTGTRAGTSRVRSKYTYNITGNSSDTNDVVFSTTGTRTNGYSSKLEVSTSGTGLKQSINLGNNGGSQSTGLCDYDYWGSTASKTYVARRLGDCSDDLICGPAYLALRSEASASYWDIGAAVLLIPPADYEPEG